MEFVLESDVSGSSSIVNFYPECTILLVAVAVVLFKFKPIAEIQHQMPSVSICNDGPV